MCHPYLILYIFKLSHNAIFSVFEATIPIAFVTYGKSFGTYHAASSTKMSVQAVILDVDGTLIDSNDLHAQAFVDTFATFDYKASYQSVRRLIGMGSDKLIPKLTGLESLNPLVSKIAKTKSEIFAQKYLGMVRAFDMP